MTLKILIKLMEKHLVNYTGNIDQTEYLGYDEFWI